MKPNTAFKLNSTNEQNEWDFKRRQENCFQKVNTTVESKSNAKIRQKEKASLLSWELKVNNPFFLGIKISYLTMD